MKVHKITIAILLACAFLFNSCNMDDPDPCTIEQDGGIINLSLKSIDQIGNYLNAERIIFETGSGEEVAFEVGVRDTLFRYNVFGPCEEDTTQSQRIVGQSRLIDISLANEIEFDAPINIRIAPHSIRDTQPSSVRFEGEDIIVFRGAFPGRNGDAFFYNFLDQPELFANYFETKTILGKTFEDVYESKESAISGDPLIEVLYNVEFGIVYMKDTETSKEYVYSRKE